MAAPEGNQFWKIRSTHGRDTLFATAKLLEEAAIEYFDWCNENPWIKTDFRGKDADEVHIPIERPYSYMGLCLYLKCSESYFRDFRGTIAGKTEDFSSTLAFIDQVIKTQQYEGAMIGTFNAGIVSRLHGYTDKSESLVTTISNVEPTPEEARKIKEAFDNKI